MIEEEAAHREGDGRRGPGGRGLTSENHEDKGSEVQIMYEEEAALRGGIEGRL